MKKKALLFTVVLLVLSMLPISAIAHGPYYGNWYYTPYAPQPVYTRDIHGNVIAHYGYSPATYVPGIQYTYTAYTPTTYTTYTPVTYTTYVPTTHTTYSSTTVTSNIQYSAENATKYVPTIQYAQTYSRYPYYRRDDWHRNGRHHTDRWR